MRIPTRTAVLFLGAALLAMSTTYGIASSQSGSGKYDTDGDGLIEVEFLEQLDAIRHDLDGDGITEGAAEDEYAAYPVSVEEVVCNNCYGYELARPLDFAAADSYASGVVSTDWTAGGGLSAAAGTPSPLHSTATDTLSAACLSPTQPGPKGPMAAFSVVSANPALSAKPDC